MQIRIRTNKYFTCRGGPIWRCKLERKGKELANKIYISNQLNEYKWRYREDLITANTEQWTGIHRHHYVIGALLQIQRNIKLIDNWSNKTDTLRHRIQRTAGEVLEPANNSLIDSRWEWSDQCYSIGKYMRVVGKRHRNICN